MKYAYKHSTTLFIVITMIVALGITAVGIQTARAEDVRKAIESGNAKFMEAFNQGDSAAVAALYTEDATVMPPNSDMIRGRHGIQDFWLAGIQGGLKDLSLTTVDVSAGGDTAYEIGTFSLTAQPKGQEPVRTSGKYVVVWHRSPDSSWKLHVDIWNSNTPAQ
jgi:uncharacterized protein (TIGR02246 family)